MGPYSLFNLKRSWSINYDRLPYWGLELEWFMSLAWVKTVYRLKLQWMVDDVYLGLALCICYSEIVEAGVHNPTTEIHYLNTVVICFNLSITLTHWTRCKNKSVVKKSNLGPESGPKTLILRRLIFWFDFLALHHSS